ncbi:MAG: hypothetical protein SW833_24025 [Cyanobacteriota bacterium]|nr:hypothetical protein [Cyanobacteriota bacterium]
MGRQAKLRQQRKQSSRSAVPPEVQSADSAPSKPKSAIAQFLKRLNPFSTETEDLSWLEEENSIEENNRRASAIARESYPTHKRGFVLAVESPEGTPRLEYLPRRTLEPTLRQYGVSPSERKAIADLVKSYDPQDSFVVVYCDLDKSITASTCLLSPE